MISIHALREEGEIVNHAGDFRGHISIHALREEGDVQLAAGPRLRGISIHALREEGDAKTETKSLFSYKLYNILHEFRRALIYNGSKSYPNHAK